jgi:hypothetical protein
MADAKDMHEIEILPETARDPLPTLPSLRRAEAKPQNPENPRLIKEDLAFIENITLQAIGMCPADAEWDRPIGFWVETLNQRSEPMARANLAVHDYFVEQKGRSSDLAVATDIIAKITPEINQVAINQLSWGFRGPASWKDAAGEETGNSLKTKIDNILSDSNNRKFFTDNASFKDGLTFMRDVLISGKNPDEIYEKHSQYMGRCIQANAKGEIILYIPFESDFTHPVQSEREKTQVCEAMVSVLTPMVSNERKQFERLAQSTWEILKGRRHAHQINKSLNIIAGMKVVGAGFDTLSSMIGEAFIIKRGETHEHGFYLAINNLAKKMDFWKASLSMTDVNYDDGSFYKNLTLLHLLHEQGHRLFPEYGAHGEVPADIPAVICALKIATVPELIGTNYIDEKFDPKQLVTAILTEYVSEVVNSVSDTDWFEGHNSNSGNELFDGYLLSGVVVVNALAESGVVKIDEETDKIRIDLDKNNIQRLFSSLEETDNIFHEKNHQRHKATLEKIKLAVANPEATRILQAYREKVGEIRSRASF